MNKPGSFPARTNPLWRNRNLPGAIDIDMFLNGIPNAACLVDKAKDSILFFNNQFSLLGQFPESSQIETQLNNLFETWNQDFYVNSEKTDNNFKTFSGELIPVLVGLSPIDSNRQFFLLNIIKHSSIPKFPSADQQLAFERLFNLNDMARSDELENYLSSALESLNSIVGIDLAALFRVDSNQPGFARLAMAGNSMVLPLDIPSSDLMRLSKNTHWTPGQPARTEIHRAARVASYQSLVTITIGDKAAISGLFIAGTASSRITDEQIKVLKFFANLFGSQLRNYVIVKNLTTACMSSEKIQSIREQLFNSSQDGIILFSPELIVQEINPAGERILGYASHEVVAQPIDNVLIGPTNLTHAIENARLGEPTLNLANIFLHRRNGQSFPCNMRIIPVEKDSSIQAILVFFHDISEDEQIRMRTQQLEQRAFLGDFTAIFAHEVRNPINNISTGLQLLASLMNSDDPNQDVINRMLGDCTRLNQLMESILSFSRPMEIKLDTVNLSILLNRILDRWRPRFARVNVTPFFQVAVDVPNVIGDLRSLDQVFTNLISNAVEAMSKTGGTLAIKISEGPALGTRSQVEITVSDNGPGIPDDVRDRIFEPFVTTNSRGNGLGLAITKRIVTAHHGSIGVNSFPGGTVFHICLPVGDGENL